VSVCTTTTEWIRENISKPIEEWEQRTAQKCKKKSWWNPLKWLCWLVTILVKVIRWVVVSVLRAVISTVCRIVTAILGFLWDLLRFLGLLFVALVTWDKCKLQEALGMLGNAIIRVYFFLGQVIFQPFGDAIREEQLRSYVKEQIEKRFAGRPEFIALLKKNFHIDAGVFGYRLNVRVFRLFVDSRTIAKRYNDVPNLAGLHRDKLIDLYRLAGFDGETDNCAIFAKWYRPRPQTAVFPFASGGGGIGDPQPPQIKRDRLQEYIDSVGAEGPHFRIYSMWNDNLDLRTESAAEKGRQLGLILDFKVADHEVTEPNHMEFSVAAQPNFMKREMGRVDKNLDATGAQQQLCSPLAAGVFRFNDNVKRGNTNNLFGTTVCPAAYQLDDADVSGVTFIDDIPDEIRRYVLIHELGHYFGLCHVDGFHHIMVSGAEGQGDAFTWDTLPNLFFHGGPWFELWEAKQAWDYILDHFSEACLVGAALPPEGPFM
jgi:hypothetical protein